MFWSAKLMDQPKIEDLLMRLEVSEKRRQRQTLLLMAIPMVAGLVFLWYSGHEVRTAKVEKQAAADTVRVVQQKVQELQAFKQDVAQMIHEQGGSVQVVDSLRLRNKALRAELLQAQETVARVQTQLESVSGRLQKMRMRLENVELSDANEGTATRPVLDGNNRRAQEVLRAKIKPALEEVRGLNDEITRSRDELSRLRPIHNLP